MTSSRITLDKRGRTYSRLIGSIRHALNQALSEEQQSRGLTQAEMARILGRNSAFISRKLAGTSNMTLETLADLAFALDRTVRVELPQRVPSRSAVVHKAYEMISDGNVVPFTGRIERHGNGHGIPPGSETAPIIRMRVGKR